MPLAGIALPASFALSLCPRGQRQQRCVRNAAHHNSRFCPLSLDDTKKTPSETDVITNMCICQRFFRRKTKSPPVKTQLGRKKPRLTFFRKIQQSVKNNLVRLPQPLEIGSEATPSSRASEGPRARRTAKFNSPSGRWIRMQLKRTRQLDGNIALFMKNENIKKRTFNFLSENPFSERKPIS